MYSCFVSAGSLAACCAEVESRTRVDPRNGQPMPDQANVKAACLAYKKPEPAAAPAAQTPKAPSGGGKMCYGLETDSGVSRELCTGLLTWLQRIIWATTSCHSLCSDPDGKCDVPHLWPYQPGLGSEPRLSLGLQRHIPCYCGSY